MTETVRAERTAPGEGADAVTALARIVEPSPYNRSDYAAGIGGSLAALGLAAWGMISLAGCNGDSPQKPDYQTGQVVVSQAPNYQFRNDDGSHDRVLQDAVTNYLGWLKEADSNYDSAEQRALLMAMDAADESLESIITRKGFKKFAADDLKKRKANGLKGADLIAKYLVNSLKINVPNRGP